MLHFKSNGKLLLSGEYVVLDGAKALAIPTAFGQSLTIEENDSDYINWNSYDEKGQLWFNDNLSINNNKILKKTRNDNELSNRLIEILKAAQELNIEFLKSGTGYLVSTHLDFNRHWGLGTSSTLINNIANWSNTNAFELLAKTFGGSGYDIACAQNDMPITYQLNNQKQPFVDTVEFQPPFHKHLYFVYLNIKRNSREGIASYKSLRKLGNGIIDEISKITDDIINCRTLLDFNSLIDEHEQIISDLIKESPVKSRLFKDFQGSIKSLGAWGGDFILVATETDPKSYFHQKGFGTVISYDSMIKKLK